MVGQVVIDYEHIPALLHKYLGHTGGREGRHKMQARGRLTLGHHHQRVF